MSIFPTKILLATDGSEEAALATQTAVDIAGMNGSELHVVFVGLSAAYVGMGHQKSRTSLPPGRRSSPTRPGGC